VKRVLATLVVVQKDLATRDEPSVLLCEGGAPSCEVHFGETCLEAADHLFYMLMGFHARTDPLGVGWTDLRFTGYAEVDEDIHMLFAAHVPDQVAACGHEWAPVSTVSDQVVLKGLRNL
jgi:hypothetical protein